MKEFLACLAVGIPAFILVFGGLFGLHIVLGDNTGPALVMCGLVIMVSFGIGALLRNLFSSTVIMYRLKMWVRK